jgi:hypothetical protein
MYNNFSRQVHGEHGFRMGHAWPNSCSFIYAAAKTNGVGCGYYTAAASEVGMPLKEFYMHCCNARFQI